MAVQIVDARNPLMYYTEDLMKYASELEVFIRPAQYLLCHTLFHFIVLEEELKTDSMMLSTALTATTTSYAPRQQSRSAY